MIRKFGKIEDFAPVKKFNEERYDINFDLVFYKDENGDEDKTLGWWSKHSYFAKPTVEQVRADIIDFTTKRYTNDGLTPPNTEDIDVTEIITLLGGDN